MDNISVILDKSHRDYTGSKMGMWLFLVTEFFLFAGPLLLYAVYRYRFHLDFQRGSAGLDMPLAALNTVILITSSLTVSLAIVSVKKGSKRLGIILLGISALLGMFFIMDKYIEWSEEFRRGIYPGSPSLLTRSSGEVIFYGLYFFMTGLHGLHLAGGIVLIKVMILQIIRGKIHETDFVQLENSGLYWHLVDIIWIYLFPLFYLIH
ncbi:MAG: cytochrome c oxidase subunit 3 [Nitrospira sp.]|nr:cytochrome c oxidase subunit 3 [Nitrospira sp.]